MASVSSCLSHPWGGFSVSLLYPSRSSPKSPLLLFCPQSQEIEGLCLESEGVLDPWFLGSHSE